MNELLASTSSEAEMVKILHEIRDIVTDDVAFKLYTPIQVYASPDGGFCKPQHWADYTSKCLQRMNPKSAPYKGAL